MYQVILVIVTLPTILARVALPRATIPENITDCQISIFQVMDDINELGEFTKEYLTTYQNLLFNQINHPRKKEEYDDFTTNLERKIKFILCNGTHRECR